MWTERQPATQEGPAKPLLCRDWGIRKTTTHTGERAHPDSQGQVLAQYLDWPPVLKAPSHVPDVLSTFLVLWKLILAVRAIWHQVIDRLEKTRMASYNTNPFSPSTMPPYPSSWDPPRGWRLFNTCKLTPAAAAGASQCQAARATAWLCICAKCRRPRALGG